MPRIDAQVHVAPSRAETSVVDLERHCRSHGLYRVVLVQNVPAIDETRLLLELAEESERVAGLVGWVDFESRETPGVIADLASH
ncbi:MAG: hypothetical protein KDA28_10480, partial [Phycisphaerales bacterium]|nr:hypothetical protein [Phycisphaerales bacterium]